MCSATRTFDGYIKYAIKENIIKIKKTSNNDTCSASYYTLFNFDIDGPITRDTAMLWLVNAFSDFEIGDDVPSSDENRFVDHEDISNKGSVYYLANNKIINNNHYKRIDFSPKEKITRAETSKILCLAMASSTNDIDNEISYDSCSVSKQ
jgi:hypothetical protein